MTGGRDEDLAAATPDPARERTVERVAAAGAVGSTVRHDARNKVASIRNAVFYLRRRLEGADRWEADPRVPVFFDLVEREIEALSAVLADEPLAALLRDEPVDLAAVASAVVERVGPWPGADVELELEPGVQISADPTEAALAVRCLLENALEASAGAGGAVRVTVRRGSEGHALLEVRDDGPGLGALTSEEAMRSDTSTKPGRAGMGLAIVRRFAARCEGALTLVREGGRTVARLRLAARERDD